MLNLAWILVFSISGLHTLEQIGLAVYVFHKTRSKDVITINWTGLCTSYDELQRILSNAVLGVSEQIDDGSVFIPPNIIRRQFTQFAIDNLHFSESTLDASRMHVTSMVMFQTDMMTEESPSNAPLKSSCNTAFVDHYVLSLSHHWRKCKKQWMSIATWFQERILTWANF